jgi:hypothetical protein
MHLFSSRDISMCSSGSGRQQQAAAEFVVGRAVTSVTSVTSVTGVTGVTSVTSVTIHSARQSSSPQHSSSPQPAALQEQGGKCRWTKQKCHRRLSRCCCHGCGWPTDDVTLAAHLTCQ